MLGYFWEHSVQCLDHAVYKITTTITTTTVQRLNKRRQIGHKSRNPASQPCELMNCVFFFAVCLKFSAFSVPPREIWP
jgi:hypothetical protein